jgi:hypothetical protein
MSGMAQRISSPPRMATIPGMPGAYYASKPAALALENQQEGDRWIRFVRRLITSNRYRFKGKFVQ